MVKYSLVRHRTAWAYLAEFCGLVLAFALGFLLAFLIWRGLTVECPEWEEEGDPTTLQRAVIPSSHRNLQVVYVARVATPICEA